MNVAPLEPYTTIAQWSEHPTISNATTDLLEAARGIRWRAVCAY